MRYLIPIALFGAAIAGGQAPEASRGDLNAQLPEWMRVEIQNRIRFEGLGDSLFDISNDDGIVLNRVLASLGLRVHRFLRFEAQGQDARAAGLNDIYPHPNYKDRFDLRQGFVVVGDEQGGLWDLKVGRQELIFGSERLLGINRWANLPRTWDAVKLALHKGGNRIDVFTSSVVRVNPTDFDEIQDGFNVHGAYAQLAVIPGHVFEPHVLWRTRPTAVDERGNRGDADVWTSGLRLSSSFDSPWSYELEADWQAGEFARDDLRAFMGMGRLSYFVDSWPFAPRFVVEYTYASGDREAGDGRIGVFDQILVRAHRIWGIVDHIGGRNSRIALTGAQLQIAPGVSLKIDHHLLWLASRFDGLYRHNGVRIIEAIPGGAESTFIGNELDIQATYAPYPYLRVGGGFGQLWRGGFLRQTGRTGNPLLGFVFAEFKVF